MKWDDNLRFFLEVLEYATRAYMEHIQHMSVTNETSVNLSKLQVEYSL